MKYFGFEEIFQKKGNNQAISDLTFIVMDTNDLGGISIFNTV